MSCPICRYETGDGKYCKKCGARLIIEDSPVFAAMKEQAARRKFTASPGKAA